MSRFVKRFIPVVAVLFMLPLTTGCYFRVTVHPNEMGVRMSGGKISEIVGPGIYDGGLYASMEIIDVSNKTTTWQDPALVTRDKQPIGLLLGMSYARKRDADSIRLMFERYRSESTSDEALATLVQNRVPRVAKSVTAKFSLNEMLGIEGRTQVEAAALGRELVSNEILELLKPELAEFGVELSDVGVNDIAPDKQYLDALSAKAKASVDAEVAVEKTKQLVEQVKQEEAQTKVSVEIARRENLVAEEKAKVYALSPEAYELKRLELLQGVVGDKPQFWFVPQGTDLSLLLSNQQGQVVPIQK